MVKEINLKDFPEDKTPSLLATFVAWVIIILIWGTLGLGLAAAIKFLATYLLG